MDVKKTIIVIVCIVVLVAVFYFYIYPTFFPKVDESYGIRNKNNNKYRYKESYQSNQTTIETQLLATLSNLKHDIDQLPETGNFFMTEYDKNVLIKGIETYELILRASEQEGGMSTENIIDAEGKTETASRVHEIINEMQTLRKQIDAKNDRLKMHEEEMRQAATAFNAAGFTPADHNTPYYQKLKNDLDSMSLEKTDWENDLEELQGQLEDLSDELDERSNKEMDDVFEPIQELLELFIDYFTDITDSNIDSGNYNKAYTLLIAYFLDIVYNVVGFNEGGDNYDSSMVQFNCSGEDLCNNNTFVEVSISPTAIADVLELFLEYFEGEVRDYDLDEVIDDDETTEGGLRNPNPAVNVNRILQRVFASAPRGSEPIFTEGLTSGIDIVKEIIHIFFGERPGDEEDDFTEVMGERVSITQDNIGFEVFQTQLTGITKSILNKSKITIGVDDFTKIIKNKIIPPLQMIYKMMFEMSGGKQQQQTPQDAESSFQVFSQALNRILLKKYDDGGQTTEIAKARSTINLLDAYDNLMYFSEGENLLEKEGTDDKFFEYLLEFTGSDSVSGGKDALIDKVRSMAEQQAEGKKKLASIIGQSQSQAQQQARAAQAQQQQSNLPIELFKLIGTWNDDNWNIEISGNNEDSVRADPEDQQNWNYAIIEKSSEDPNFPYKIYFFGWGYAANVYVDNVLQDGRPHKAKLVGNKLRMVLDMGGWYKRSKWTRVPAGK